MSENNQSQTDNFFSFFEARLDFVKSICIDRIEGKILLCSYIDSLSGYMYGFFTNIGRFEDKHSPQELRGNDIGG